jgi:hypothetical protein
MRVWGYVVGAVCAGAVVCGARAGAQGVDVSAGASSLLGMDGVTMTRYLGERMSLLSVGVDGGRLVMGGATEVHRPDGFTRYGDTALAFTLPTDIDAAGRSVGARGVDWEWQQADASVRVFAGKTGNPLGFGYLSTVEPARWAGSVVVKRALSPQWDVEAIGAAGAAHAALGAAQFVASPGVTLAGTAGCDAGHGLLAVSAKLRGESWSAVLSETLGRVQLRPETAVAGAPDQANLPERGGFNASVQKRLTYWLQGDAARVEYARDVAAGLPDGAQLLEAGLTARDGGFAVGARGYASADGGNRAHGLAGLSSWTRGAWKLEGDVMESWNRTEGRAGSVTGEVSRAVGARVVLSGGAQFAGSSPASVAGVEVHGAWGSAAINQRMVYVPFGPRAGFVKVAELSLHLHPQGVETSLSTLVGTGVPWSYTAAAEKFVETQAGGASEAGVRQQGAGLDKYVVRGLVVDEAGQPVPSAAVRVGQQRTVWTDSDGVWESRARRAGVVHLQLATAEFVTARQYRAVDADAEAWAAPEDRAQVVVLRVRSCVGCGQGLEAAAPAPEVAGNQPDRQPGVGAGGVDVRELLKAGWPWLRRGETALLGGDWR